MTDRELMQMANRIEALAFEMKAPNVYTPRFVMLANEIREAIRARLAQPEPEPVAWISAEETWLVPKLVISDTPKDGYKPVYTAPPQRECVSCAGLCCQDYEKCNLPCTPRGREQARREWQTLTENEIKHLWYEACQTNLELTSQLIVHLARNIETKLKEMNSA